MSTEQFRWIDDNPEKDSCEYCSVCLVGDRIDISSKPNDVTIGVVTSPADFDHAWATVQIDGRSLVYRTNYKPPRWILLRENVEIGPHGPLDEYFIRG